ncbi:GNAT family N-acetyltransferase [Xenorhabdus sp. Flor]|uniref:GNAT family N-acetyltransferase n=1 Tax=Xenorhabdus cabanillasii TaxID=351673 RepID=UPI0019CD388B|nr:GNAT family N-acetyltransferase [Xenorhabdus sp. Flor]MBD2814331.1 GNAT family N-acetyltransferase [Xenorhabdus sp. Flor]
MIFETGYSHARWSVVIEEIPLFRGIKEAAKIKININNNRWKYQSANYKELVDEKKESCEVQQKNHEERGSWNMRCNTAVSMLDSIKYLLRDGLSESSEQNKLSCFVVYIANQAVGILIFSWESELPRVKLISTHPGSRNCGIILMEKAVNESKKLGKNGVVWLSPVQNSELAYLGMGLTFTKMKI